MSYTPPKPDNYDLTIEALKLIGTLGNLINASHLVSELNRITGTQRSEIEVLLESLADRGLCEPVVAPGRGAIFAFRPTRAGLTVLRRLKRA